MKKVKPQREADVVILPVTQTVLDVFTGKGWDRWSRVEVRPTANPNLNGRFLRHVAGERLFPAEYTAVLEKV